MSNRQIRGDCPGCGTPTYLVRHHWGAKSIREATKLGKVRLICYGCNTVLSTIFGSTYPDLWDTQLEALRRYYGSEEEGGTYRSAVGRLKDNFPRLEGSYIFDSYPNFWGDLGVVLGAGSGGLGDDWAPKLEDWWSLGRGLWKLDLVGPTDFWVGKIPDDWLPFVGTLEYRLKKDLLDRLDLLLRGALLELGKVKGVRVEEVLRDAESVLVRVIRNTLPTEDLVSRVLVYINLLEGERGRADAAILRCVNGKVTSRCRTILGWLLTRGEVSGLELSSLYSENFGLRTRLSRDIRKLEGLGLVEVLVKDEVRKVLVGALVEADESKCEVLSTLVENCTTYRPSEKLVLEGTPTSRSLGLSLLDPRYSSWIIYSKGVPPWEELKRKLVTSAGRYSE